MKKTVLLALLVIICSSGAAPRKLTWAAIGDSITYLNDHPDQTGNRITKGYMSLLTERYPLLSYRNYGRNGWTAVRIAEQIDQLDLVSADVYTVFLGTNDWWQGKPLGSLSDYRDNTGTATVYGAFRIIINKLRHLNKKAGIILITPMQRGDFVYIKDFKNNAYGSYKPKNGQTLAQFAEAVKAVGKLERLPVVDLYHENALSLTDMVRFKRVRDPQTGLYRNYTYPEYTNIPFDPEKDDYPYPEEAVAMTYDGLHPSDEGYEVIADLLAARWRTLGRKHRAPLVQSR